MSGPPCANESSSPFDDHGTPTVNALTEAGQIGPSGPVASWINLDLPEALHRFPPQFVKAFGQTVCEFTIPDEERRESALLDEGMVQRQHHGFVVHYVKRMPELAGVPHARHLSQVVAMQLQELHQLTRALIREAEQHSMLDAMLLRILGDAPEDGKPAFDSGVDGHQIAGFHVRQDALPGRCQRHEVSPIVTLDTQRQIDERVSAANTRLQSSK